LDDLRPDRAALFAELLRTPVTGCDFPELGQDSPVVVQRVCNGDATVAVNRFDLPAIEGAA
jgi:hypothetical protein